MPFPFHGHPRIPRAIDLLIPSSPENADQMMDVLKGFGFAELELTLKLSRPDDAALANFSLCQ
jgi:hypothetical protein